MKGASVSAAPLGHSYSGPLDGKYGSPQYSSGKAPTSVDSVNPEGDSDCIMPLVVSLQVTAAVLGDAH